MTLTTRSMQRGERDVDNSVYAERRVENSVYAERSAFDNSVYAERRA